MDIIIRWSPADMVGLTVDGEMISSSEALDVFKLINERNLISASIETGWEVINNNLSEHIKEIRQIREGERHG